MERFQNQRWLKIVGVGLLILVLTAGLAFAGYKLGSKRVQHRVVERLTPTPFTSYLPSPTLLPTEVPGNEGPTANWKTYRATQAGFEIKYPPTWEVREATGTKSDDAYFGDPAFKDETGKIFGIVTISYSNDPMIGGLELENIPNDVNLTAIGSYDSIGLKWETILIGGVTAKRARHPFCQSSACDNVLLRNDAWTFGLSMNQADERYQKVFDLMLSTFRFLPSINSGQGE